MKKYLIFFIFIFSSALFAQKAQPAIQAVCTSIDVNVGSHNLFADATHKRDLAFTLDGNAELKGPLILTNTKTTEVIFKGTMEGTHLVDSAIWYDQGRIVRTVNFKKTCCTNNTDNVEPSLKPNAALRGERHGIERVYYSSNPDILKSRYTYESGRKVGKQYDYDSVGSVLNIRTYLNGILNDTSWLNCTNPNADIEIYKEGKPAGVWKQYDATGMLTEEKFRSEKVDSIVTYSFDGKISSVYSKSDPFAEKHSIHEYDSKLTLRSKYFLKERWDNDSSYFEGTYMEFDSLGRKAKVANYAFSKLTGEYEEYENGKLSKKGHYFHNEQIGTWYMYSPKGKITGTEQFKNKEDIIVSQEIIEAPIEKLVALDLFPDGIVKPVITITLAPNGKIAKLLKKYPNIEWGMHVKNPTNHEIICEDSRLSKKEQEDVKKYLKISVTQVKTVHYDHKEAPFTINYQLVYQ